MRRTLGDIKDNWISKDSEISRGSQEWGVSFLDQLIFFSLNISESGNRAELWGSIHSFSFLIKRSPGIVNHYNLKCPNKKEQGLD